MTVAAHRNEEKHHAAEGETARVAQVTCVALNDKKRMKKNDSLLEVVTASIFLTADRYHYNSIDRKTATERFGGAKMHV